MNRLLPPLPLALCASGLLVSAIATPLPAHVAALAAAHANLRLGDVAEGQRWLQEVPEDERAWEWQLLSARADQSLSTLDGFAGTVLSLAIDPHPVPDGPTRIALSLGNGEVLLLDAVSGARLRSFVGHTDGVYTVDWSPDGSKLVSASRDATARVWDVESGDCLITYTGHAFAVAAARFSPDGSMIASASYNRYDHEPFVEGTVHCWSPIDGAPLRDPLLGGVKPLSAIAFTPDGKQLAAGSWNFTTYLWDLATGDLVRQFDVPEDQGIYNAVDAIAMDPQGRWLATSGRDHDIRIFDLATGALVRSLTEPTAPTWSLAVSLDGSQLAAGGEDHLARLYDTSTWELSATWPGHTKTIRALSISYNPSQLYSGSADRTLREWSCTASSMIDVTWPEQPSAGNIDFLADGHTLISSTFAGDVSLWNTTESAQPALLWTADASGINLVAISPDGLQYATCNWDGHLTLWTLDMAAMQASLTADATYAGGTSFLAFSPDGRELAIGALDKQLVCYAVPALTLSASWPTPAQPMLVDWHPAGTHIACALRDGGIAIIERGGGDSAPRVWSAHPPSTSTVVYSPDGTQLASGGQDAQVTCWDWATGTALWTNATSDSPVSRIAWHPTAARLAVASMHLQILDARDGMLLITEHQHPSALYDCAFSPDGSRLAACSSAGIVHLWDSVPVRDRLVSLWPDL